MKIIDIKSAIDRYKYEKEIYTYVNDGDKQKVKIVLDDFKDYSEKYLRPDNKNIIVKLKYLCITAVSIFSRMSVEKGKSVSESYALADDIFRKCEFTHTLDGIVSLIIEATESFTNFNYIRTDLYSLPIRKTIDYINNNLDKKILIEDIKEVSKLSNDYLSLKFKEEVGINLSDYILNKRLDAAKKYLMFNEYSKDTYKLFGFSTQSYFIQCFKKAYNITPKKYYMNVIEKKFI